jgi:hypothetical protein
MNADRYLRAVLTIIAVELGWIALAHTASPVRAQQAPTPVVITGIDLERATAFQPVGVLGQVRNVPAQLTRSFQPVDTNVRNERAIAVSLPLPVDVRAATPIRIETDRSRPIWVENVGYTPARQPGE